MNCCIMQKPLIEVRFTAVDRDRITLRFVSDNKIFHTTLFMFTKMLLWPINKVFVTSKTVYMESIISNSSKSLSINSLNKTYASNKIFKRKVHISRRPANDACR